MQEMRQFKLCNLNKNIGLYSLVKTMRIKWQYLDKTITCDILDKIKSWEMWQF